MLFILLVILTGIQLIYLVAVFGRLVLYMPSKKKVPSNNHSVSVVICAHNELENLQRLLPALLKQDYDDYEIVLVDDRSNDGTEVYIKTLENIKYIKVDKTPAGVSSKKYALTKGIEAADKEVILLTDADCMPLSNQWIKEMQLFLSEEKELVLGFSPYQKIPGSFLNLLIRFETLYTAMQYLGFALAGIPYMGVGRNMAYKKSLFIKNGGLQNYMHVTGGDDDLFVGKAANSKNTTINIKSEAQTESLPKMTYGAWWRQKIRHLSAGSHYNLIIRLLLGFWMFSVSICYALMLYSGIFECNLAVLPLIICRTLVFIIIFAIIGYKLGQRVNVPWILILEPLWIIIYWSLGLKVLFSKNIQWK